jgi:hypothetical protein
MTMTLGPDVCDNDIKRRILHRVFFVSDCVDESRRPRRKSKITQRGLLWQIKEKEKMVSKMMQQMLRLYIFIFLFGSPLPSTLPVEYRYLARKHVGQVVAGFGITGKYSSLIFVDNSGVLIQPAVYGFFFFQFLLACWCQFRILVQYDDIIVLLQEVA